MYNCYDIDQQGHFEIFSILLYILVKVKIEYFKRSNAVIDSSTTPHSGKWQILESMAKNSLSNSKTNLIILTVYFSVVIVTSWLNQSLLVAINEYPNYLYVYFSQLWCQSYKTFLSLSLGHKPNKLNHFPAKSDICRQGQIPSEWRTSLILLALATHMHQTGKTCQAQML